MATTDQDATRRHANDADVIDTLPGTKHKVIGLVSGGKDSTFNLLHCIANGHEVVALATLTPERGVDELDSHMYQSVGTNLLPLLAQAMDLPLITRVIKGKAVARGAEYGSRLKSGEGSEVGGDETEDLYRLLVAVKDAYPECTALASGAILSSYQRLRIEHVCSRLGLVSLSYLWQAEQLPLLDTMLSCGMEVILMKVAGVGLGIELVGKTLRDVRPLLGRLERQYGSHPAGEGGEYETLTLSTPLFSHTLRILESEVIITDPEPYPVAYLKVTRAELVDKPNWARPTVADLRKMLGLDERSEGTAGLDELGLEAIEELDMWSQSREKLKTEQVDLSGLKLADPSENKIPAPGGVRFAKRGRWFAASMSSNTEGTEPIAEELKRCFDAISERLDSNGLSLPLHTAHVTLLLPSMSLFAPANAMYASYFGTSPPSRATVAVPLQGGRIKLEIVGFDDRPEGAASDGKITHREDGSGSGDEHRIGGRQALHVQGQSYWAPANIGPYSQAVIVNSHVHIAGQIPLIPATLTLPRPPSHPESPYNHQATLALQHVRKVRDLLQSKQSTGGGWSGWCESVVGWWVSEAVGHSAASGVEVVRKAWEIWAEQWSFQSQNYTGVLLIQQNDIAHTPALFLQAHELPRGALVEYQVNWHTGRPGVQNNSPIDGLQINDDNDDDDDDDEMTAICDSSNQAGASITFDTCIASRGGQGGRGFLFIHDLDTNFDLPSPLMQFLSSTVAVKLYYHYHSAPASFEDILRRIWTSEADQPCITYIPVYGVYSRYGRSAIAALEVFST